MAGSPPFSHRKIILALDRTPDAEKVEQWARSIQKDGDIFYVLHVAKVLGHKDEVFHGIVGTSLNFYEKSLKEAKSDLQGVKEWLKDRVNSLSDMKNVEVTPVLLVESTDAPASAVAEAITRYRDEVHADLIIAAKSNKTLWEKFTIGSTAQVIARGSTSVFLVA